MEYSLNPIDVKSVIDAKLNGRPHDEAQFLYYHLCRNHFNVHKEINTLQHVADKKYKYNLGNIWEEVSTAKNFFHMPLSNWAGSIVGISTPYSRKFLRDDNVTGIGGEFEMIIRHDGKRIDALTDVKYQETYNFARTRNFTAHKMMDVDTHTKNGDYTFKQNMGQVIISDNPVAKK